MRVVTGEQMKQIEKASLNYDLTYHRLMENAGSAAAAFIRRTFRVEGLNCMIFCGSGNNGGDGLVVARKLFEAGAKVLVVMVGSLPKSVEAISMYDTAKLMDIPIAGFASHRERVLEVMGEADIIIDAIYGTGFRVPLDDTARDACTAINSAIAAVVALDLPSGVNCDNGEYDPDAVKADFTIVFDSHKPAHAMDTSSGLCGQVELADIGIPDIAREGIVSRFGKLNAEMVFDLLPPRDPKAHKGIHGRVLAVCGSTRYRGAAVLSTLGALRAGAGLVTLASIEPVCAAVAGRVFEVTFLPMDASANGQIDAQDSAKLTQSLQSATAVLFGCGLGSGDDAEKLLRCILHGADCPVIIDADGINALAGNIDILQEAKTPVILTPHPGEMARLCGVDVAAVETDRNGYAARFARQHGVVVALKGHKTLIAEPGGGLFINTTGNAGLAKGGSGDVLAGMCAAFAAQGVEPYYAAACAVFLHGLAADRTATRRSQYAMLPSELLDDLARIFAENGR